MESEFNSKSNPWNDYESFQIRFENWEDWLMKARKFDRIALIAEQNGKIVEYTTYMSKDGFIIIDVICH